MSQNQNRIHEVFPYLRVKGAPAAIDFYKKVFGATERASIGLRSFRNDRFALRRRAGVGWA